MDPKVKRPRGRPKGSTNARPDPVYDPNQPDPVLVVGASPPPIVINTKQELLSGEDLGLSAPRIVKDKVWFVIVLWLEAHKDNPYMSTLKRDWLWAHTKSYARDLAIAARKEGKQVIDIFPGTKERISHKFRGLK